MEKLKLTATGSDLHYCSVKHYPKERSKGRYYCWEIAKLMG